jgi:hypothetical protein
LEVLSCEIKSKYIEFDYYSFKFENAKNQLNFYDDQLPYLSFIVNELSLLRFKDNIDYFESVYVEKSFLSFKEPEESTKEKKSITEYDKDNKSTFNATFNDKQIEILTECINEVKIFSTTITSEVLKSLFTCTLKDKALRSSKNRLLVYLFDLLNTNEYIAAEWQSTICNNKLILAPKKNDYLNIQDLSSANDACGNRPPKGHEKINIYIDKLKKHSTTEKTLKIN